MKRLLITLLCLHNLCVQAQFEKFKSKMRDQNSIDEVDSQLGSDGFSDDEDDESDLATSTNSADTDFSNQDPNTKTFGNRVLPGGPKKNDKYVNLNLETGFGPEIIESFDFPDTEIMDLTKHMQKLTGMNLILDKDVKGKVSITAPGPITVGDAWKAYLAALNMAGYSLVKAGAFYKIINTRDVRYVPLNIYTGRYTPDTETYIMKIIPLKNVDASEISRSFRTFMSRYGRIFEIKQTNTIIMSDTGSNIARLEKLIKFLDVPGFEESLQIIPVKNSSAQEIAKLLDEILQNQGGGGAVNPRVRSRSRSARRGDPSGGGSNISKIIAEQRTNSIIAMANAEGAKQLRELIQKLDVKLVSASAGRIHVHYLNYGNAEELAQTLSTLISGAAPRNNQQSGARRAFIGADENQSLFNDEVKVTADKNNNALVVTATPTDWLTLKNVIAKLDIPRDQVYVEGIIMETSITKIRAYGTEYLGAYGSGNAARGGFLGGSNAGSGGLIDLLGGNPTNINGFFTGITAGRSIEIPNPAGTGNPIRVNSVNGLIKAISSNSATNVLATPQILAMDNTDAEFEVGETVPVVNTINTNGTVQTTQSTQEAKLSLKITPQINKVTRFVKLKINQTINAFKGETVTTGVGQATTVRSAVTEVLVRDRDTIAMGGLLRDEEQVAYNKVPLLGDIPVLGWLFKNKSKTLRKVNLLMFLTPKILSPYQRNASAQTLETIKSSNRQVLDNVDDEVDAPFQKQIKRLSEKVEKQTEGPLFNSNENIYLENNEDIDGIGAP